ncbi:AAA family ATPase [Enterobacter ludwigii]|uniref:UvrD-helicase domain-containing protein n=1 Tax=Enterobacter ludwigii TaxID=299767 RepID=UPI001D170566|nr:UvrD-helicase domain-containing protein [Enterobacter ludwigii]UEG37677.1 AAA family ATPase [Enterobacter ludwigii]UEG42001.1 AAA family ATPase [Enterobacter ludwigii]
MKVLSNIRPTPEQLSLVGQNREGVEVICGAAGSGKTTTALLRLKSLCYMFNVRHQREGNTDPVKILVLTFNKTLAGYIKELVHSQLPNTINVELEISTFSKWAYQNVRPKEKIVSYSSGLLYSYARAIDSLSHDYVVNEVEYLLGRFKPENLSDYITAERTGRGISPRVERTVRQRILDEVVTPYKLKLQQNNAVDWNDVAIAMREEVDSLGYEIVVVDECQDFTANQLRAIKHHLGEHHTATFVTDTVQRIYARGYTWSEAGYDVRPERSHILRANYRNTREIAAFAASVISGINVEADGALPNLNEANSSGNLPKVIVGFYNNQVQYALDYINKTVDLTSETVAFLHPKGWFGYLKPNLMKSGIPFVDITRADYWPDDEEVNVAISTFHSAKGLEFDYVFILGLSDESTAYPEELIDDQLLVLRRLLTVAIARAKKDVIIGYKSGEESDLIRFFSPGTFTEVIL